ncbi:MAG: histidinol-phosphate transaminase [Acutalibacteraceae bacterium]|jgi:histidinol-phosphate aminotransferase
MAFELNEKVKKLKPYDPICGDFEIRLDANESFIQPSDEMMVDVMSSISNIALNRYPDSTAYDVCEQFAKLYDIPSNFVVAGNGSDEIISVIMTAFLQKGDKVITLTPDFSMYNFYTSLVECECIEFAKDDDFNVDFDKLILEINNTNARMVIFSNPCNPTSVGFLAKDVKKLVENTNALIVLDEAYMDFWNQSLLCDVQNYDNLIILRTCSKAIGLASIRLGFAVANTKLINVIKSAKSPYNVNSLTQAVACSLLSQREYIEQSIEAIKNSLDALYFELKKIEKKFPKNLKIYKSNTNFVFIKTQDAKQIFEFLKTNGIIVRNMNGYLRITAGSQDENQKLLNQIKKFYKVG